MSTQQSKGEDAPTLGIGGPTSGEAGSTLTHETMAETGGSGGDALTKPRDEETMESMPPLGQPAAPESSQPNTAPEGADTAATATARGAQDTRSQQAGINPTGLGTPETGGNQSEQDLAPPYRK
ncbi:hypothetical protein ACI48D_17345 [Massilia sp. LXY-6]|uniref:hypothetical protein n=1 Tax=Massilia sp. LXY-6 TaxID=3379823 RepID=UPI003EE3654C